MRKIILFFSFMIFINATEISILDATIKDKSISGVEVIFQKEGESSIKVKSDSNGKVTLNKPFGLDDNSVMMILKKDGYASMAVKCPCDGFVYAMSPVLKDLDSMRVVLQWDSKPNDMDLHAIFRGNHIFWDSKYAGESYLDVDDRDGYGPETITIKARESGQKYIFFVHNFSVYNGSMDKTYLEKLKNVKVYLYAGSSLLRTYNMPKIPSNLKNGNVWIPFYIDEEGKIIDTNIIVDDINKTDQGIEGKQVLEEIISNLVANNFNVASSVIISQSDKKEAKKLNNLGEKAYHAKNYDKAIEYYNSSISLNPDDGQTYSNLGLAYQKLGNNAEAIWANRKAIDLASGKNAATIKASSYYNIGRIYEDNAQFEDALANYKKAFENKNSVTYQEAIDRVSKNTK